jgi:hypothetical protein
MNMRRFLQAALLFSLLAPAQMVSAQTGDRRDGMRFVPNVTEQVFNLTQYADPLGLDITTTPNPSACRHYQGMARVNGADGTPFFLVTRSGNTPNPPGEIGCDDSPGETRNGHLVVFRLDSRDKNGERLRSNRLARLTHVDNTKPNGSLDRATVYYTVTGGNPNDPDPAKRPGLILGDGPNNLPPRVYQHPGGMQLVGNILAIALEEPRQFGPHSACVQCVLDGGDPDSTSCQRCLNYERATEPTLIQFYDVSNPEEPVFKSQFVPKNSNGETLSKAGVVAVTPLPNGKYLMVITGGSSNNTWFFYRSNVNDLSAPNLTWEQVRSPLAPDTADAHQTLNFLREGNINGRLFLAGARGHVEIGPWFEDRERIDLYEITCATPNCEPGEDITWTTVVNSKRITPRPSSGGDKLASLAAASTFYVSPSGEVILYATEHDNDGPGSTMKAGEFRHVDVVRAGSPTLLPSAKLNGPFVVDEGSAIDLTGSGQQPITKAFIQLWHDKDFKPLYLTASYDDRNRDDFDELFVYEPIIFPFPFHSDKARSWNWFAPQGCSIQAIDRTQIGAEIDEMKTLTGATSVQADADLELVMHDGGTDNIDREVDRILFGANCDAYYSAVVNLFWDLNRDGTFETQGNSANFNAAQVDGPVNLQIPIEARHAMGGAPGTGFAAVTVRNVAPQLSEFRLTDSGGGVVNSTVPFVLTGLPVTVAANFSDPGVLDHQTAVVSWGDGATESNPAFATFDEAFGDGAGNLAQSHSFSTPGTYTVELKVNDDDGGQDVESTSVRVLTPEQAVVEVIGMIDNAIANTTDANVRTSLRRAKRALTGTNANSQDGALAMIRANNPLAAVAFLDTSVNWLTTAQQDGANVAVEIALLKQISAALGG